MRPFDVYRGEQVGEGRKSIAFSVSFQSAERTLTDEDAAALRERIVAALRERFGAELEPRGRREPLGQRPQHLALDLGLLVEQPLERAVGDHERAHRRGRGTVAVRGESETSAISPKKSPAPSLLMLCPSFVTSASPSSEHEELAAALSPAASSPCPR